VPPSGADLSLFLAAALVIAVIPGPGIFYVAARTLSEGRKAGIASTLGTALGGLVHVIAGGLGVSAIILASAEAFTVLKFAGALYLVWLGIRAFREAGNLPAGRTKANCNAPAFREGIVVEATNPKTAAFFLAFIPQFLDTAAAHPALQFMVLGLISVALNTIADLVVVATASATRNNLVQRPRLFRRLRQGSGLFMGSAYRCCWRGGPQRTSAWKYDPAKFKIELTQDARMDPPIGMIAADGF
jgi:threonine/homoserine/homoserine lactone efflux protein